MSLRRVVRVRLGGPHGRLWAYRCHGCRKGDRVRIRGGLADGTVARVEGFGRRGWLGRLEHAERVEGSIRTMPDQARHEDDVSVIKVLGLLGVLLVVGGFAMFALADVFIWLLETQLP